MSDIALFAAGCFVSLLCVGFVVASGLEMRRLTLDARENDPSRDRI